MHTINADSIAEGHEKVIRLIMDGKEDVNDVVTEDKELTFEYPEPVNIHIKHPDKPPFSSPALQFGDRSLNEYRDQILNPRPLVDRPGKPDFSYLYSDLAFDFPRGEPFKVWKLVDMSGNERIITTSLDADIKNGDIISGAKYTLIRVDWPHGNGRGDGTNQVNYVVKKLVKNHTSRRAKISLFEPHGHPAMDDPPCLNDIQFMLRKERERWYLNMHALFRSNDMLSAWGGNAYGLTGLQKHVLDLICKEEWFFANYGEPVMGWLETTSISAHIYWKRDQHELDEFKKRWC